MEKVYAVVLLLALSVLCGCISSETREIRDVEIRYVCSDGKIVYDSRDCVAETVSLAGDAPRTSSVSAPKATQPPSVPATEDREEVLIGCAEYGCPEDALYVASTGGGKYHLCTCSFAKRIKRENIVCFRTNEEAEAAGYSPCSVCLGG